MSIKAEDRLFHKLCSKVGKTIYSQEIIKADDNIAIGLSGGKDSFLLLEILANRRKHLPFKFQLHALHIHVNNVGYKSNKVQLQDFCDKLEVPFHYIETDVDHEKDKKKAACFVCSWTRRKRLFEISKTLNCNKLALGHHNDDALETMLMNMVWHGSISAMPYSLRMFHGRLHLIRPLLDICEKEIIECTDLRGYPQLQRHCPHAKETIRGVSNDFLFLLDKMHKDGRKNMFRAMNNIYVEYLPNGFKSLLHMKPTSGEQENNPDDL